MYKIPYHEFKLLNWSQSLLNKWFVFHLVELVICFSRDVSKMEKFILLLLMLATLCTVISGQFQEVGSYRTAGQNKKTIFINDKFIVKDT